MKTFHLTDTELGYLAGIIDGEGSLLISRRRLRVKPRGHRIRLEPCIHVCNTNRDLSEYVYIIIKQNLGAGMIKRRQLKNPKWKPRYDIQFSSLRVLFLLKAIEPFLKAKREQCELLIKWCQSRLSHKNPRTPYTNEEIAIFKRVRALNRGLMDKESDLVLKVSDEVKTNLRMWTRILHEYMRNPIGINKLAKKYHINTRELQEFIKRYVPKEVRAQKVITGAKIGGKIAAKKRWNFNG